MIILYFHLKPQFIYMNYFVYTLHQCYNLFSELIDPVTAEVHQIDEMKSIRSEVNLNWKHIKGGKLYGANVLSCRLGTSTRKAHVIEVTFLLSHMQQMNSIASLCKTKSTLLRAFRQLIMAHFIIFGSSTRVKLRT